MSSYKLIGLVFLLVAAAMAGPTETDPLAARATHEDQMLNNSQHRQIVRILALPELQPELGLSATQVATLRSMRQNLLSRTKDIAAQIITRKKELDNLLSGDTSRTRTVKALYDKLGELHADMQYAAFDTTVKMKAALNAQQRDRFESIKPTELHRLMMSRGSIADMETLMHRMGLDDGRMQGMIYGGASNIGMMSGGADVTDPSRESRDAHH
jgi:hypothetical protein